MMEKERRREQKREGEREREGGVGKLRRGRERESGE